MIKFYKLMFAQSLIMGTLIAISSYSWMSMWIGLEINLLSLIPLMSDSKNLYPSEAALKYFITQALASSLFLFSIIVSLNNKSFTGEFTLLSSMIMNSALLTKIGAAPFHFWFPEVIEGLNWLNSLIILTWQKIAPFILLMNNLKTTTLLSTVIIISSITGGLSGINQTSLRKIMAYSSINHIGWMIASNFNSQSIWMAYFLVYSFISMNLVFMFSSLNTYFVKQLFSAINNNKTIKLFFVMNFMSLGGLPPFLGFLPKWMTINNLVNNEFMVVSLILIISTLITLFFYLRIMFPSMTINTSEMILQKTKNPSPWISWLNFISLTSLLVCTLILEF